MTTDYIAQASARAIAEGDDHVVTYAELDDLPREHVWSAWVQRLHYLYVVPLRDVLGDEVADIGIDPQTGGGCHGIGISLNDGSYLLIACDASLPATYGDEDLYTGDHDGYQLWGADHITDTEDGIGGRVRGYHLPTGILGSGCTQAEWVEAAATLVRRAIARDLHDYTF